MNSFTVSYVTTLPKKGNAPRVEIKGNDIQSYNIFFYHKNPNTSNFELYVHGQCKTNQVFIGPCKQWYTEWFIKIEDSNGNVVFTDTFNVKNKVVFIKMDAHALGDNIAWIPYVEEFRKKYECTVICSTFHNHLFTKTYPNILFVKPNTVIENVYAQYYIGAHNSDDIFYCPIKVNYYPLQMVASSTLGLKFKEIKPDLKKLVKSNKRIDGKYVTLSEFGSSDKKHWKEVDGWQKVVDYLNTIGYKVVVVSKEKTSLKNVIDISGNYPLSDRITDIYYADFHMGVSSGLSWLAWSLDTHVFMISDVTPNWHEFKNGITRINSNHINNVNYEVENYTKIENVINNLNFLIKNKNEDINLSSNNT